MKTYALQREQERVRPGDADTGELPSHSFAPGPVPKKPPSANPAAQLQDALRARRREMEILRSAMDAVDAARSRAETPERADHAVESSGTKPEEGFSPSLPLPDIRHPTLPQLLLLRPEARRVEPAAPPDPEAVTEEPPAASTELAETPDSNLHDGRAPESEPKPDPKSEPTPDSDTKRDEREPAPGKAPLPRTARVLGRVAPGSHQHVPGPLVFEVHGTPTGRDIRPADTPPGGAGPPPDKPTSPTTARLQPRKPVSDEKRPKEAGPDELPEVAEPQPKPDEGPAQKPEDRSEQERAEDLSQDADDKKEAKPGEKPAGAPSGADIAAPPPDNPTDALDVLDGTEPAVTAGPESGAAGGAPLLDAWKSRAIGAATSVHKPDLGPSEPRTKSLREHGKKTIAKGRKRRKELPKEAKPIFAAKERQIGELSKVPAELKDDPVGAVKAIKRAAREGGLPAQQLPLLRSTPGGFLPNLYGDPISPVDLEALKKQYQGALDKAKKDGTKPYDEMAVLLEAFKKDLADKNKTELAGRIAVFEGQNISGAELPPKPEIAPAHQPDIAAVLARIVTETDKLSKHWVELARKQAYANQALSKPEVFPKVGDSWAPEEAKLLHAEMQRVREAAGISKEQLDEAVDERRKALAKGKNKAEGEGDKAHKEVKDKVQADFETTQGTIEGLRREWEDWADELAAQKTNVDWKAVRRRQHGMEGAVEDMANDWIVAYDDMRKVRLQKLKQAAKAQKKAYEAALAKDKEVELQKEGVDAEAIDKRSAEFLEARMKAIGKSIGKLDDDNEKKVQAWQKRMRKVRSRALDDLQKWADKQIGRTRSWIDDFLARIFRWRDGQKGEARAFAKQRARETTAAMGSNLGLLYQKRVQFGDDLDEKEKAELAEMSEEQRTVIQTYYKNGKDTIGAVAAGLRVRLRSQRVPKIEKAMRERVLATPVNSAIARNLMALSSMGFGVEAGAIARACKQGFDHRWGTDEDKIHNALAKVPAKEVGMAVRGAYWLMTGSGKDFNARLKSELAGGLFDDKEEYDQAKAQLEANPIEAAAAELRVAVEGAGTDEDKIKAVLRRFQGKKSKDGRTLDLKLIKDAYKRMYGESLDERLDSELSGADLGISLALAGNNKEKADAIELKDVQSGWLGPDKKGLEKVYQRVHDEEWARGRAEDLSVKQIEDNIRARLDKTAVEYSTEYKGASLKEDYRRLPKNLADLAVGLQDQDWPAVDAARLEIERRGIHGTYTDRYGQTRKTQAVYADDKVINKDVLGVQYDRAYEKRLWEAERKLREQEKDWNKTHPHPWSPAERRRRMAKLRSEASIQAQADAKVSMQRFKETFMKRYEPGRSVSEFDNILLSLTSGTSEGVFGTTWIAGTGYDEAKERLKHGGYLPPHKHIEYATKGAGTDEDRLKAQLRGKTKEEIDAIRRQWEAENEGKSFDKMILGELSGRDRFDVKMMLKYGEPTDPVAALALAKEKLAYEARTGGVEGRGPYQRKTAEYLDLEAQVKQLDAEAAAWKEAQQRYPPHKIKDKKTGDLVEVQSREAAAYDTAWQAAHQGVNDMVALHRQAVDARANLIAGIVGAAIAVIVGALLAPVTGGASLGLILFVAGVIAGAATAATMVTKWAIKGEAYAGDEIAMDLAFGAVDFVITAFTLGAGKFIAPALKGTLASANAGKTTVRQAINEIGKGYWTKGAKRLAINQAQTEAAQGLYSTVAVPAFMDEYGRGMNPLANTILTLGLTLGGGIGLGMGVKRAQRMRKADFDFDAQAKARGKGKGKGKGKDLLEVRGNPEKLKNMRDAYLKDNPHRTAMDFLKDYDELLLKMMKDQDFKAKWQKSARRELLQDIDDPKLKRQLTETPVDLISDKEFLRLTGSKKGYAVVMMKDGVPTVVLRQGAPASALREEGQHLLQAVQKKWAGQFKMLDEANLRDWKVKDPRQKLIAYDAKLDLEIDANEQYLLILRNQAKGADVPPQLADQIAGMELMLRNLYKRKLEVADIGPLRRTLMGWGSIFEPQYLRQRPRLFGKHPGPKMKLSDSEVLENIELPKPWNYPAKYFPFKPRTGPPSELAAQLRLLNAELAAKGEKVRIVPHPAKGDDAATFARIVSASDPEAPPPFIFLRDATDPPAGKNALSRFRLERNPGGLPPAPEGHYYFRDANGDYSLKKIGDPSLPGKRLVPVEDADDLARGLTHRVEDVGATRWEPATHKGADTGADWDAFMLGSYRPRSWDPNLPPRRVSRSYEDFRGFVADLVQGQARNHPTNPRTLTKVEIDAEIHRNLDEVLAGMSGQKTVDKVRHAFKQRYGAKIDDWIQDGLEVLADPSASRTAKSAAVAESLERLKRFTTSPVNVKDQGNVAERWYQAMRRKQGRQLHHEPVLTKGEKSTASPDYEGRKPDFADLEDKALVDVKSHKDSLSGDDVERLNAYLTAVSDEGGAHLTHRTLEGVQGGFDKVRVVFTNLEGARASTKKLQTLLPDRNFSFEVFDARGVPHRLDWKGLQALKKRLNAKSLAEIYERGWPNIDLDATPPRGTPQPPPGKTPATPETGRAPRTGEGGGERPPPAGEGEATPRHPREAAGPEGSPEPELGRTPDGTHEVGVDAKGPFRCSDSCRLVQDTYAKELGERPDLAQRLAGLEASSSTGGDKAIRDEAARLVQALEDQRTLSRLGRKELASEIARTPSGTPRADKLHYELHRRDTLGKGRIPQSYRDWLSFRPPPGNPYASLARLGLDDLELGTLRANEIPAEVAETLLSRGMKASQLARTADSGGPTALRAIDRISAHPDFDMARARSLAAQAQAEGGLRALDETTPDTLARLLSRGATEPDLMRILGKHGAVGLRIVDGLTARSLAGESLTLREAERIARLATGIAALPALYKGIGLNLDPRLAHVPELTATLAQSRRLLNPRVLSKLLKKIGQEAEEIHGLTKRPATKYGTLQQVEDAATRATRGPGRRITMETWSDPARTTPRPYEADVMEHRSGGGTTVQHKEVSGGMDAVKSNVLGAVEQLRGAKGKGKTPEVPPPGYTGIADVRVRDPRFGGDPTAWEATRQQLLAKLRENLDLVSLANTKVKHPYHPDLPESLMWKEIRITNKHGTHIFTPKDLTDPPPSP